MVMYKLGWWAVSEPPQGSHGFIPAHQSNERNTHQDIAQTSAQRATNISWA